MVRGWVTLKKPFSETLITECHCSARHAGENRVGVDAGVVDQNLDGAFFEQGFERRFGGGAVGDIEGDGLGTATVGNDCADDGRGFVQAAIGVDDDVMAVSRQTPADCRADAAAAASNQGTFHEWVSLRAVASSMTAARPSSRQRPAWLSEN
jgi:hypothetical protein